MLTVWRTRWLRRSRAAELGARRRWRNVQLDDRVALGRPPLHCNRPVRSGCPQGALFGNPFAVAQFVPCQSRTRRHGCSAHRRRDLGAGRCNGSESVRRQLGKAAHRRHGRLVAAGTTTATPVGDRDRRGSDGARGSRLRTDDLLRREEGGSRAGATAILTTTEPGGQSWTDISAAAETRRSPTTRTGPGT